MKPSDQITKALDGALDPDDMDYASISALSFHIYMIASKVLLLKSNTAMKAEIEKHPSAIQTLIRAECRRLYDYRKKLPPLPSPTNQARQPEH